jgi:glutathione S-transferase
MRLLVIGDKQLSSWSLRPWLALRHLGLEFEERSLPLDTEQFRSEVKQWSPTGRVPVLIDGTLQVWDSLAICEYASELASGRGWPESREARADARSIAAEMHSGFAALRRTWPLQAASRGLTVRLGEDAAADVARVEEIWSERRERHGALGPWLYGAFCIADAMYAPVALRFASYGARLGTLAQGYVEQWLADAHLRTWLEGAAAELRAAGSATIEH